MDSKVISLQLADRSKGEAVQPKSPGDEYPVKIEFDDVVSPTLVYMTYQFSPLIIKHCYKTPN